MSEARAPRSSSPAHLRSLAAVVVAMLAATPLLAQPRPVIDLFPGDGTGGIAPYPLASVGSRVVFGASDPAHGTELWSTDGTVAERIVDLCPGPCSSYPGAYSDFTELAGELLFPAFDGEHGWELWATDGTRAGTRLVADICPGPCGAYVQSVARVGDLLVFRASSRNFLDTEPWVSDGTAAGTRRLADLCPGDCSSDPRDFTTLGDEAFFVALGPMLWATDGTPEGTRPVRDLGDGSVITKIDLAANDAIWFSASQPATGRELWRSDGTFAGTQLAADINPGPGSSWPVAHFALGDKVYVGASATGVGKPLLYAVDVAGGVGLASKFANTVPDSFLPFGDDLLAVQGDKLWRYRASLGPPTKLVDLVPGGAWFPLQMGSRVLVSNASTLAGASATSELWWTDGTPAGTTRGPTVEGYARPAVLDADRLLIAMGYPNEGRLVVAEGTAVATAPVTAEVTFPASSFPVPLASLDDTTFVNYYGSPPSNPVPLWRTDGTAAGTADTEVRYAFEAAAVGERLAVSTYEPPGLGFLPAEGGPLEVATGTDYAWFLTPAPDAAGRPRLFFGRQWYGQELWVSDGTAAGTERVVDLNPNWSNEDYGYPGVVYEHYPSELTPWRGEILFAALPAPGQYRELWASDGTATGTRRIAGPFGHAPLEITAAGERAVFSASTLGGGRTLWTTDGTAAGTARLDGAGPDGQARTIASPSEITALGDGRVAFISPFDNSFALWTSDGRPTGTRVVRVLPGVVGARELTALDGGRMVFVADALALGTELWTSDGTAAGTVPIEVRPGYFGGQPRSLVAVGRHVYFAADDGASGLELWTSDGTADGTRRVADLAPGLLAAGPTHLVAATGHLDFSAWTPTGGRELWTLPLRIDGGPAGETELTLRSGRYGVTVRWRDPRTGNEGTGTPVAASGEAGHFWFFGPDNLELLVKVLDGAAINGHVWVFASPLTDLETWLTVTDLETGAKREYHSGPGLGCGIADTAAFAAEAPVAAALMDAAPVSLAAPASLATAAAGTCPAGALCLAGGEVTVKVRFRDQRGGLEGAATPLRLTADSGLFWFFSASNLELTVKVLDGRPLNGHRWVFWGALTDVEYWIDVEETATGATRTYHNPPGRICGGADTAAL